MGSIALQRSKNLLEKEGYHVWIVEYWHAFAGIRRDLYNMCDLTALRADVNGITGIQCCGEDIQGHIQKILAGWSNTETGKIYPPNPFIRDWLSARNNFFIYGWVKRGARGKRKLWECRKWKAILSPEGKVSFELENTAV